MVVVAVRQEYLPVTTLVATKVVAAAPVVAVVAIVVRTGCLVSCYILSTVAASLRILIDWTNPAVYIPEVKLPA